MKLTCKVTLYMQGYSHKVWIGERNLITHLVKEFLNSVFAITDIKVLHINRFFVISQRYWIIELTKICSILSWLFFYRITDFENNKRRLYLSTVHKELSVTPLHAKIPLFMIKRKIVGTSGIFPGLRLSMFSNQKCFVYMMNFLKLLLDLELSSYWLKIVLHVLFTRWQQNHLELHLFCPSYIRNSFSFYRITVVCDVSSPVLLIQPL